MDTEFERYFSKKRLECFGGIDNHKDNLLFMQKISPKLQLIEIAIRNISDQIMKNRGYDDWLNQNIFNSICKEFQIPLSIVQRFLILIQSVKSNNHDHLISQLNFGFWSGIIEQGIIDSAQILVHHKEFINFSRYAKINRVDIIRRLPVKKRLNAIIILAKNIRNRAFHCENLLKLQPNGFPRISYKITHNNIKGFISVEPKKIEILLNDLLKSINKEGFKDFI